MPDLDIIQIVKDQLQAQIDSLRAGQNKIEAKTQRSETAGGMPAFTYADAPRNAEGGMSDGVSNLDTVFISNGRKSGEIAGAGTGVPCYFDATLNDYRKFSDDLQVTV